MILEEEIWQDRPAPNRNFPKQGIDRQLIANENNDKQNDKQKRIWGYKGQRIGKTSGPGPWSLEQKYNEETVAGAARGIKAMRINIMKQYDNTHYEAHKKREHYRRHTPRRGAEERVWRD